MQDSIRPSLLILALLGCPLAAPAQPADEAVDEAPANVVTLGDPPAGDPLSPDRAVGEPVTPRDADGNPLVDGILGIPATRLEVDPRVLGIAPGQPLPTLRREGEFLRNRTGRLLTADQRGYAVFVLDADEALDEVSIALVVAPNRALESMQELVKKRDAAVGFTVSGQVHTYRGVNYLMITAPPRPMLENATAPAEDEDTPAVTEAEPVVDAPSEEDIDETDPLSPEEELEQLLGQRGGGPLGAEGAGDGQGRNGDPDIRLPDVPRGGSAVAPAVLGTAPGQVPAELLEEGVFVVQRTGRIVRSGDGAHALFVFDADGAAAPEPPMILQACKLLEEVEATLYEFGDHLPLVITGQVQTYRGANYLLPSIMRQEFDRGNLE
ncbi:hypothetical protein OT109_01345 [Phycisphaeraceae bacterium D3-23]